MTDAKRLAMAVLLFHRGGPWTGTMRDEWVMLTGEKDATTKTLCDLARRIAFGRTVPRAPERIETADLGGDPPKPSISHEL